MLAEMNENGTKYLIRSPLDICMGLTCIYIYRSILTTSESFTRMLFRTNLLNCEKISNVSEVSQISLITKDFCLAATICQAKPNIRGTPATR